VGAIKPQKDYHLALDAAQRLVTQDPRWRVLFLGDQLAASTPYATGIQSDTTDYKSEVLAHYERLGLKDRIRFAGLRKDVAAIVRGCDVLFATSRHEGFPNAVLEAMGLGVPVVSTEYSDIRRILPFAEQVVPRSPDALSAAILWARSDRETIGARQQQWVQSHATIEKAARELERVYRRYVRPEICVPAT
jgi:glycosyltransferase involved in cell wall biosynthesis